MTPTIATYQTPDASIILINRNGGEWLRRALADCRVAIENAVRDGANVELIVVDNGSTDDSVAITEAQLAGCAAPWRIVQEATAGVNSARNAGLRAAQGRYVIFTDNDLRFSPDWLRGYLQAFAAHPDARVFAGRVLVGVIEGGRPPWLDVDGAYSRPSIVVRCDNGDEPRVFSLVEDDQHGPVGPNMAFERAIFDDHGWFDTNFGLRPGSVVAGAEAEYFHRLGRAGEQFAYVPAACVWHPLKRSQINKSYFKRRLHGVGRVVARIQRQDGLAARRVLGIKCYLLRALMEKTAAYLAYLPRAKAAERFYRRCEISIVAGQIHEDFATRLTSEPHEAIEGANKLACSSSS